MRCTPFKHFNVYLRKPCTIVLFKVVLIFSILSGNLWIPFRKNCTGLEAFCFHRNKWKSKRAKVWPIIRLRQNFASAIFQIVFNRSCNMRLSYVMIENIASCRATNSGHFSVIPRFNLISCCRRSLLMVSSGLRNS